MSLDGFVTGPNLDRYPGLGEGGDVIQAWVDESRAMDFAFGEERQITGSIIAGRRVYDATGSWAAEDGFFRLPVFVVTHRPHDVVVRGETTFVTEGIEQAIEQASGAAEDKRVHIMGGASIIQQALAAGLVDELFLHVAPIIMNSGTRLFEHLGGPIQLERAEAMESRLATHLRYRIRNQRICRLLSGKTRRFDGQERASGWKHLVHCLADTVGDSVSEIRLEIAHGVTAAWRAIGGFAGGCHPDRGGGRRSSAAQPVLREHDHRRLGGHGMIIIAAVARRWGHRPVSWAQRSGKVVWAEVELQPAGYSRVAFTHSSWVTADVSWPPSAS